MACIEAFLGILCKCLFHPNGYCYRNGWLL